MGLQEELIAALDAERVVTGADELRRHGTDEGWHSPAAPDVVVYPRDTEEAAAVVRICARPRRADRAVRRRHEPRGPRRRARRAACRVDMTQMNAILRLSVEDMDVTVQAGVTRRQLDEKLRPEGVFFSVDPGADATIGGMAATGASGTTSVRYGTMRENVLCLTVVTARGRDRAHPLAGAQVERRLRPHAAVRRLRGHARADHRGHAAPAADARGDDRRRVPRSDTLEAAVDTVIEVLAHAIPVARIELLDDVQIDAVNRHFELDLEVAPDALPRVPRHPGRDEGPGRRRSRRSPRGHGVLGFDWAADEARAPRALARPPRRLRGRPARCGPARRASPPTPASRSPALADVIAETKADLDASGLLAPIVGHVGDGNFHLAILVDPDDPDELRARQDAQRPAGAARDRRRRHLHRRARRRLRQDRAFLELEHGPHAVAMMRAIKSALDPKGLFNPGKVARPDSGVIQLGLGPHRGRPRGERDDVCLAIPGQIVEVVDESNQLARVDVAGVRRTVNIGLFDDIGPGDWVLIHVGFAISVIDEAEARATRELLEAMGAEYEQELHRAARERDRMSCDSGTASPARDDGTPMRVLRVRDDALALCEDARGRAPHRRARARRGRGR